jgi:hypothetical protein
MKTCRRATLIAVALVMTTCLTAPTVAFALSSSGELASWSPHGDAAAGAATKLSVGCTDDVKRTFYAGNATTVFVNTNGAAKTVSRNVLFRAIHRWFNSGDCPDLHLHWKWKTRTDGTKFRYVTRLEAANRSD